VDCAVNATTGREADLLVVTAEPSAHVVVVGGGPGGLEAARGAAGRGHRVTLVEQSSMLGGNLRWASIVHPENASFLEYLLGEVAATGVDVRLNESATPDLLRELAPDSIVVASGGRWVEPDLPGRELAHGLLDVVTGKVVVGRRVSIVGAGLAGVQLAELLSGQGHLVALFDHGDTIAPEVGWKRRTEHMDRLDRRGVTVHTEVTHLAVEHDALAFTPAGGTPRRHPADSVVVVGVVVPALELHAQLATTFPALVITAIGDCVGPGLIQKAVADAAEAASLV
ncbi:MAG: FAD-dependent oxidoreductase, partial [Nocardioides sp.]